MKSAPAIAFDYRPSRLIALAILVALACALIALAVCGLPTWSKAVLAVLACGYAAWSLRGFLRTPCRHLHWHEAGHWSLRDAQDQVHIAELLSAVTLGGMIALSLRSALTGGTSVLLLPDNCDSDIRRRLRVRLARVAVQSA